MNIRVVQDIKIGKGAILELKYSNYGDLLVASTESKEIAFINPNENYLSVIIYKYNDYYN